MTSTEQDSRAIGLFALACEEMNDYARSLRQLAQFGKAQTGADIRAYVSGWRLEKWIEAPLNRSTDFWAAWWLELGHCSGGWVVQSHIAVGPDVLYVELETRHAQSVDKLAEQLSQAVARLRSALNENPEFSIAITDNTIQ